MQVRKVKLRDFRNYAHAEVELAAGRTIFIGDNAQGKSNFLEAVELAANGQSTRTSNDQDFIRFGSPGMRLEIELERGGYNETIVIVFAWQEGKGAKKLSKKYQVNGLSQTSKNALLGHLVVVSFTSEDLNLLRGGPKFRRQWLDSIILSVKPAFAEVLADYQKCISQRNRLLKTIGDKGKVSVSDQDQLLAWDKQVARFGAAIIKRRLLMLSELLPKAEASHLHLSQEKERLAARYVFRSPAQGKSEYASESEEGAADEGDEASGSGITNGDNREDREGQVLTVSGGALNSSSNIEAMPAEELARTILRLYKESRYEEIRRRQTLIGPHRDDIVFTINERSAADFGSQGQQRSLVLALKIAELNRVSESLLEPPVLLLDDVLAELDVKRQGLLMSALQGKMQTIITTTHLSKFEPKWLEGATVYAVSAGQINSAQEPLEKAHSAN